MARAHECHCEVPGLNEEALRHLTGGYDLTVEPRAGHLDEPDKLDQAWPRTVPGSSRTCVKEAEAMQPADLSFRDRADAGRQLVPRLMAYAD
jgi:hypothetical protein